MHGDSSFYHSHHGNSFSARGYKMPQETWILEQEFFVVHWEDERQACSLRTEIWKERTRKQHTPHPYLDGCWYSDQPVLFCFFSIQHLYHRHKTVNMVSHYLYTLTPHLWHWEEESSKQINIAYWVRRLGSRQYRKLHSHESIVFYHLFHSSRGS